MVPSPQIIDQRLIVAQSDLDPGLNPGALYWLEAHYVAADDAAAGNGLNNASYRAVDVAPATLNLVPQGDTVREASAIEAWRAVDPAVERVDVDLPTDPVQRFEVARRVTGTGPWHYEYAIRNMNADRSAHRFKVQFPPGTSLANVGFRDVDHHSGEPYATTDWDVTVDSAAGTVTWSTDDFATDPLANALRWGTLFTFWLDAGVPPAGFEHTLGLFKPGSPDEVTFFVVSEIFSDGFESGDTTAWSSP